MFSRDPDSPAIREVLSSGGRATTVIDGWVAVLAPDADPDPLVELVDVPMTLSGLSRFNVENALAATSAALAIGLPRDVVVDGLRSFRNDAEHNPGRMNMFTVGEASVVVDLAHNEAGLEALIEVLNGVRRPGSRLLLGLGAVGDRQDDLIEKLGEIAARDSDVLAIAHKQRYLRGRDLDALDAILRAGAERVGVTDIESYPTEVEGLAALVKQAEPGDAVGLMCHAEREAVYDWIADHGGRARHPRDAEREGARGSGPLSTRSREQAVQLLRLERPGRFAAVGSARRARQGARRSATHPSTPCPAGTNGTRTGRSIPEPPAPARDRARLRRSESEGALVAPRLRHPGFPSSPQPCGPPCLGRG